MFQSDVPEGNRTISPTIISSLGQLPSRIIAPQIIAPPPPKKKIWRPNYCPAEQLTNDNYPQIIVTRKIAP